MRTRRRLASVLAAGVLVLAGAGLASCGNDETTDTTTEPTTTTETTTTTQPTTTTETTTTTEQEGPTVVRVRVAGGAPQGGIVRRTVDQGDRVVIVVTSDVADHVHLHGYDLMRDVAAGGTARIRFRATVPGRFEVELEDRRIPIADISVQP